MTGKKPLMWPWGFCARGWACNAPTREGCGGKRQADRICREALRHLKLRKTSSTPAVVRGAAPALAKAGVGGYAVLSMWRQDFFFLMPNLPQTRQGFCSLSTANFFSKHYPKTEAPNSQTPIQLKDLGNGRLQGRHRRIYIKAYASQPATGQGGGRG